jgi:predicted TIM-barrel fold metal-dependent hydrolase
MTTNPSSPKKDHPAMPIIDVHAHLGSTPWFQADRDGLLRAMERAGIQQMAVSSRLALASNFAEGNFKLKAALDGAPQLLGYVVVNPAYIDISVQEMRRYLGARNFVGIKVHPGVSGQPLASAATRALVNRFRRYQKPILVHVWGEEDVRGLEILAQECPTVKLIAAHAGGDAWAACLALAERQLNVSLEPFTGGAERDKIEEGVERIGAHRILFGTDFPVLNPGVALGMLADARLSEADKNLILGGNAEKLFGLA